MTAVATTESRVVRVAAVWGTTVVAMRTLSTGRSFELGDGVNAALPIPDNLQISAAPVRAAQGGWEVDPRGAMSGVMRLRGRQEDPAQLARAGAPVMVVPGDFGLLQYGQFAIFFQYTTAASNMGGRRNFEPLAILAVFSSAVMHIGMLGLVRTLMTPPPLSKPLELTSAEDLAARFGLHRPLVETPPPPTPAEEKIGGTGVPDPGAKDPKRQGGGQKIAGAEGKFGVKGAADHTELRGEIKPTQSYGGISDVLNSDTGEEIRNTLKTIDSVSSALSGLNSANIVLGGGPGTGFRGAGSGGGGNSAGVAFGSGTLNTGWGLGNGGGYGSGTGGAGGRGNGGNGHGGAGGGSGSGNGSGNGGPSEHAVAVGAGAPKSGSGLSAEQIRRVVMAHTGALRACYESEAQRNPNLRGGVTVSWHIEPGGSVTMGSLAGTTLSNPRVEGCVVRQVKTWHFPAADGSSEVTYPFKFGVGG